MRTILRSTLDVTRFHRKLVVRGLSGVTVTSAHDAERLLVVGSGVAGSAAALIAAECYKIPTTVVFAGQKPTDCNSYWAQGGIIYRNADPDSGDSAASLAADIHNAGAGLCDQGAVQKVATEGPDRVKQLLLDKQGVFADVPFDRELDGKLSYCLEASHAAPRILHIGDHTGRVISQRIAEAVANHPLISLKEDTVVTDLVIRDGLCVGLQTLQGVELGTYGVVLCSGGLSGIYAHTTNPTGFNALGSSVAIAARAGVTTKDLEYIQFHPTALSLAGEAPFLLTEALRGEGALLKNSHGEAFAKSFHDAGELAPRDVVSRGVFNESRRSGQVYLDITHRDKDWLHRRFPSIQDHLSRRGMDLSSDQLPVTPAAHYTCGGIQTDLNGCSSLQGLYAAGEAACTGLHGGNRLASTSLLEGLVFGASVAEHCGQIDESTRDHARALIKQTSKSLTTNSGIDHEDVSNGEVRRLLSDVKRTMWENVGVVRTMSGVGLALDELRLIKRRANELFLSSPSRETAGLRDAAWAGWAVAKAASENSTSAGAHFVTTEDSEDDFESVAVST